MKKIIVEKDYSDLALDMTYGEAKDRNNFFYWLIGFLLILLFILFFSLPKEARAYTDQYQTSTTTEAEFPHLVGGYELWAQTFKPSVSDINGIKVWLKTSETYAPYSAPKLWIYHGDFLDGTADDSLLATYQPDLGGGANLPSPVDWTLYEFPFSTTLTVNDEYYLLFSAQQSTGSQRYYYFNYNNVDEYNRGKGYIKERTGDWTEIGDWFFETITDEETPPITLLYPVPYSSQEIIIDTPISFYTLDVNGLCQTNGEDRIYIHSASTSYVPTSTDFTTQGIDCVNHAWSKTITGLTEGENNLVFWARDFIDEAYTPVYTVDYVDTQVFLYAVMTFDPGQWTTTTTSTLDVSDVPFIGENLQRIIDSLSNKIPIGYFNQIYDLWQNATTTATSTTISVDFSFGGKFSQLNGLEWDIVDLADPYNGLTASTTETIEEVVDWINYVLYFIAMAWFINWAIDTYKRFTNSE